MMAMPCLQLTPGAQLQRIGHAAIGIVVQLLDACKPGRTVGPGSVCGATQRLIHEARMRQPQPGLQPHSQSPSLKSSSPASEPGCGGSLQPAFPLDILQRHECSYWLWLHAALMLQAARIQLEQPGAAVR
jgi:hypothetical protein